MRLFTKFDPEMPRDLLKSILCNTGVTASIENLKATAPDLLKASLCRLEVRGILAPPPPHTHTLRRFKVRGILASMLHEASADNLVHSHE